MTMNRMGLYRISLLIHVVYMLSSLRLVLTDGGHCDNGVYVWRTILHLGPTVRIILPATSVRTPTFRIEYKVINCAPPHTIISPAQLPRVRVVGCEDGYSLSGDQPLDSFTCDNETGRLESESAVPMCLSDSVPATPILPPQSTTPKLSPMNMISSTNRNRETLTTCAMKYGGSTTLGVSAGVLGLIIIVNVVVCVIWRRSATTRQKESQYVNRRQTNQSATSTGQHIDGYESLDLYGLQKDREAAHQYSTVNLSSQTHGTESNTDQTGNYVTPDTRVYMNSTSDYVNGGMVSNN